MDINKINVEQYFTVVVLSKNDFAVQMPTKPSYGLVASTAVESDGSYTTWF